MKKEAYIKNVLTQIPRLLGQLDRNPYSKTYGCFDWNYWHDKIVDFPSAHKQEALLILALIYNYKFPGNIYYKNHKIKEWCIASMGYWTKIQHKDGSFDEFYPNERALGALVISTYAVLEAYEIFKDELSRDLKKKILYSVYKAVMWLTKYDEPYLLTNHQAQAMFVLYKANKIFNKKKIFREFKKRLNRIINAQSKEGWFLEYDGADLGYLTVTINFLAKYYKESGDKKILNILKKAINFSSYFIYPDGTYGGIVGSRNTAHFWPDGYEIISKEFPLARRICDEILKNIANGNLLTPEKEDRYFCEQMYDFILSYLDHKNYKTNIRLPYEKDDFEKYFNESGYFILKKKKKYVVIALKKGGLIKVFSINDEKLVYSDCGFVGITKKGKVISSCFLNKDIIIKKKEKEKIFEVCSNFREVLFYLPSTSKTIILRLIMIININTFISNIFKNFLINRLIKNNKKIRSKFIRKIDYRNNLLIDDYIKIDEKINSLSIIDEIKTIFVAYSKYFQKQELNTKKIDLSWQIINKLNNKGEIKIKRKIKL